MGKSSAPIPNAPDLSGNVKAANNISSTATNQAGQTFDTAKAYNANAQSNLSNVTGAQTPVMNKLADTTNTNLNTYGNTFVPLQQQQASDAQNYVANNSDRLRGMATADANAANQAARANSAAQLASEGVDPASVHGAALDRAASVQGAAQVAGAATNSQLNTENTGRQLTQQANALGLQVGQLANQNAATGSSVGSGIVNDTNSTNATGIQNMTADTAQLNTGVNANSSAVSAANTQFQDQMAVQAAQQAQSSSTLGSIGQIAGMAAMFMDDGGVVRHTAMPATGDQIHEAVQAEMHRAATAQHPASAIPSPAGTGTYHQQGNPAGAVGNAVATLRAHNAATAETYVRGGSVSPVGALPFAPNPAHPTDTKPALLTPGEYVIPKDVAQHKGHEFFHKMVDKARIEMKNRQAIPHAPSAGA